MSAAVLAGVLAAGGALAVRFVLRAGDRALLVTTGAPWRWSAPARVRTALGDAALDLDPTAVWVGWAGALVAAGGAGLLAGGPSLAALALAVGALAPVGVLAALRGRALAAVDAALPDLLEATAGSLRSGATVRQALAEVAPSLRGRLAVDVGVAVADADGGLPFVVALEGWAARCPTAGVRLAVAALGLSAEAGGAAARAVDGVAATLRSNLAVVGEIRAQSSQARLSALVIALSPLAFGLLAAGTDRRTAAFLLRTPFGLACLGLGLGLDAVAAWWMHRITAAPA